MHQNWWNVTSIIKLQKTLASILVGGLSLVRRFSLAFLAFSLWWNKLPCRRGSCVKKLKSSFWPIASKEGPRSNNPQGINFCHQLHKWAWKWILPKMTIVKPGQHLAYSQQETLKQGTQLRFLDLQKWWNNKFYCFKTLNLRIATWQ